MLTFYVYDYFIMVLNYFLSIQMIPSLLYIVTANIVLLNNRWTGNTKSLEETSTLPWEWSTNSLPTLAYKYIYICIGLYISINAIKNCHAFGSYTIS